MKTGLMIKCSYFFVLMLFALAVLLLSGCKSPNNAPIEALVQIPTQNPSTIANPISSPAPILIVSEKSEQEEIRPTWTPLPTRTAGAACQMPVGWETYSAEAGDSLSYIAKWSNSSIQELTTANCISDPTRIEVGQLLYVPQKIHKPVRPDATLENTPTPLLTESPSITATGTALPEIFVDFFYIETPDEDVYDEVKIRWQVAGKGNFLLSWSPYSSGSEGVEKLKEGEQGEYTLTVAVPNEPEIFLFTLEVFGVDGDSTMRTVYLNTTCSELYVVSQLEMPTKGCS